MKVRMSVILDREESKTYLKEMEYTGSKNTAQFFKKILRRLKNDI